MTQETNTPQPHILGLTLKAMQNGMHAHGLKKFRAAQVWDWVYKKGVTSPEEMTNLSKDDRAFVAEHLNTTLPSIATEQTSADGTIKWLFKMADGHEIETVFIPEGSRDEGGFWRGTLCVSSQVGCTLTCRFCHTGTQGLSRNLTADEIVGQVYMAKKQLGDFEEARAQGREKRTITNIVYMGMGEPLYNWENVKTSCHILMDSKGIGLGSRKITISTSGMVKNFAEVGELGTNFAISLHAPDTETRKKVMPITNKWDVDALMAAIRAFPLKEHRRITWEYVMLDGINDTPKHAKALVKLIEGIPSFVNIIPFNEWPGSPFKCSKSAAIDSFAAIVKKAGVAVNVRRSRGDDILAACGQLRGETSKHNTISLEYPTVVAQYGNEKQKVKILDPEEA